MAVGPRAFSSSKHIASVVLPKSIRAVEAYAFQYCEELNSVTFNSSPILERDVFTDCHKLPADITLMGLVNSYDISEPFIEKTFLDAFELESSRWYGQNEHLKYTRPDVFELAIKNDCFRSVDVFVMLRFLFVKGEAERLRFVAENGLLKTRVQIDEWIECSAKEGLTELTAYLLDLKNRKFGFNGGDSFEL